MAQAAIRQPTPLDTVKTRQNSRRTLEKEIRIALVGKTGVGKSATANTISGGKYFKSVVFAHALTQICQQQKVTRFGRGISIIDTPGIFDRESNQHDIKREIERCVYLGSPGLHAILYVMEIGRIRRQDIQTMRTFLKFFGEEIENRVIVVFTNGDKLLNEKQTLSDYLKTVPEELNTFLKKCGDRVILFNNQFMIEEERNYEQILNILLTIETLRISNKCAFYYDAQFNKAEEIVQRREEEIRKTVEMAYKEKTEKFKRTPKTKSQSKMMQGRLDELEEIRNDNEEMLSNVREEVRREIKSKKILRELILLREQLFLNT